MGDAVYKIGVTGHRNLSDAHWLSLLEQTQALIEAIKARVAPCVVQVLSSLASGADMLCAQAGIDAGCTVIAPLPMALHDYEQDFAPIRRVVLHAMLDQVSDAFIVPVDDTLARDECYRQAGLYVIAHCDALLALWDGDESNPWPGGTADTVLAARGKRPIVQLITPREGDPLPEGALTFRMIPTSGPIRSFDSGDDPGLIDALMEAMRA